MTLSAVFKFELRRMFGSTLSSVSAEDYLVQNRPFPDHVSAPFLPDVLDPAAHDVASGRGQNLGGGTQTALMSSSEEQETRQFFQADDRKLTTGRRYSLVRILFLHHICRNTCMS